jgi:Inorganic pyrophosphatase
LVVVHQGYGKFVVAFPKLLVDGGDYYDGALFLLSHEFPCKIIRNIPVGVQLLVIAVGTDLFNANRYIVTWAEQGASFDVVSSRQATIDEIMRYYDVTFINLRVIVGLFIGVLLIFLFCAFIMNVVGRVVYCMMRECCC